MFGAWIICMLLVPGTGLKVVFEGSSYHLEHGGALFATGAPPAWFWGGKWHSDFSVSSAPVSGQDKHGAFTGVAVNFTAGAVAVRAVARNYDSFVTFTYVFPKGVGGTASGREALLGNFPAFRTVSTDKVLSWQGSFVQGSRKPTYGTTGGPYLFYNETTGPCFMSSTMDNFMTASRTNATFDGKAAAWVPGISGSVESLPDDFSHSFLIVAGSGITATVHSWGQILQKHYDSYKIPDVTLSHLGYQTDNGAQYCFCRKDCNNVLLDVQRSLGAAGVRLGYLSFQGAGASSSNGKAPWCVTEWGLDGGLGPNYPADLPAFQKELGLPLQLYAPYFCNDTAYSSQWKMVESDPSIDDCKDFTFLDPAPSDSRDFYDWFFDKGKDVNLISYEPDFMNQNVNCMPDFQKDVASAAKWLDGMAGAALARNMTIQWCYATPAFVLQALHYPSVTNFRGSFDYYYGHSYDIGFSSLLIYALGAFPSKDTFWTSDNGAVATTLGGCDKKGCPEDHSNEAAELHTLLALMSTGPVGFSDAINQTNATLLLQTSRSDGKLLKPTKAITAIDSTFGDKAPPGDVYMTYSGSMDAPSAWYVVSFNLKASWDISSSDFWPTLPAGDYYVRDFHGSAENAGKVTVKAQGDALFQLPSNAKHMLSPALHIVTPACPSGWALLGEEGKFAAVSDLRFTRTCLPNGLRVAIEGVAEEKVTVNMMSPDSELRTVEVILPETGEIQIEFGQ